MVGNQYKQLWDALEKGQVKMKDLKHQPKSLIEVGCTPLAQHSYCSPNQGAEQQRQQLRKAVRKTSLLLHTCRGFIGSFLNQPQAKCTSICMYAACIIKDG